MLLYSEEKLKNLPTSYCIKVLNIIYFIKTQIKAIY